MSDSTPIEWTDSTWPLVAGCAKKSPGCKRCWAIRDSWRLSHNPNPKISSVYAGTVHKVGSQLAWTGLVKPQPQRLDWPLKWKKARKIFVCSQSDLFHPAVPFEFIDAAFMVMAATHRHTHQVLTKEPERMLEWVRSLDGERLGERLRDSLVAVAGRDVSMRAAVSANGVWPLRNVWLGTSVENQEWANQRREPMRELAARGWHTWVSNEPALGPIDWSGWEFIKWMVSGGESGSNADPSHPVWMQATRDFCAAHGIAFLFKQWGAWWPISQMPDGVSDGFYDPKYGTRKRDEHDKRPQPKAAATTVLQLDGAQEFAFPAGAMKCFRVGKKAAGRLLDGRTHDEFPA